MQGWRSLEEPGNQQRSVSGGNELTGERLDNNLQVLTRGREMKQMYPGIFWLKLEAEHFLLFVVVGNRSSSFLQNNTPRLL